MPAIAARPRLRPGARAGGTGGRATAALAAAVVAAASLALTPVASGADAGQDGAGAQPAPPMPAPDGEAVLEIGVLLPLTGGLHGTGAWMDAAVDKSAADLNARLERDEAGWSVRLAKADTATYPEAALKAARAMQAGGIDLVVEPASSSGVDAVRALAAGDGMVLLSCCSSASFLSVPGDSVFRLAPNNTVVASFAAGRMLAAGADAAVVAYRGDAWGEDLASAAAAAFEAGAGAGSASGVRYDPGGDPARAAAEISDRLAAIDVSGARRAAVLLVGFEETAGILAAAGEVSLEAPAAASALEAAAWFGINVYDEIVRNAGAAAFAERVGYGGILAGPDGGHPLFAGVSDHAIAAVSPGALRADPDVFTSYDAVQILAAAASAAGTADAAAVAAALPAAAAAYRGTSGNTSLNAAGDRNSAIFEVWAVRDGGWMPAAADGGGGAQPGAAEGGGCLVATAAYGTELAVDVQALRELRDEVRLSGHASSALVSALSAAYYSASPHVADLQREHPHFGDAVEAAAVAPIVKALRAAQLAGQGEPWAAAAALGLLAACACACACAAARGRPRAASPERTAPL